MNDTSFLLWLSFLLDWFPVGPIVLLPCFDFSLGFLFCLSSPPCFSSPSCTYCIFHSPIWRWKCVRMCGECLPKDSMFSIQYQQGNFQPQLAKPWMTRFHAPPDTFVLVGLGTWERSSVTCDCNRFFFQLCHILCPSIQSTNLCLSFSICESVVILIYLP